MPIEHMA